MIATSIEQSYELLAAGLSPESADMHYSSRKMEQVNGEWRIVLGDLCVGKCESANDLPAWSCARVFEISGGTHAPVSNSEELIKILTRKILHLIKDADNVWLLKHLKVCIKRR